MKVLITGATGFVGSHTVSAVAAAGHEPRLFVRSPERIGPALKPLGHKASDFDHLTGDVNDVESVERALSGCDAVIHAGSVYALALPFWKSRRLLNTNIDGTANVLETAHRMGLDPIVHVSSGLAIFQSRGTVLTEDSPPANPPGAYGKSKVRSDKIARRLQEQGAPVVITYPPVVWGPHDPYWGETAKTAESVITGKLPIAVVDPAPYCDIRDVAQLHAAVLEPGRGSRRYLVPSHNASVVEIFEQIGVATGRQFNPRVVTKRLALASTWPFNILQPITPFRLPGDYVGVWWATRGNTYAQGKAQDEFGIKAMPFSDSVRDTLAWMATTGRLPSKLFGKLAA